MEVLRSFAMNPPAGTRITLISPHPFAIYSGMVPGFLGGQYDLNEAQIDVSALAARAGARYLQSKVTLIDADEGRLDLDRRPSVLFDIASFDIGAKPLIDERIAQIDRVVMVKPIEIAARDVSRALASPPPEGGRAVVIVGGGAGGVEIAFAAAARIRDESGSTVSLIDRAEQPLIGRSDRASALVTQAFDEHRIVFRGGRPVLDVDADGVHLSGGEIIPADLVVWATGADAPGLFRRSGLDIDARGFLSVDDYLRAHACENIFGVGDCATLSTHPLLPKAGVYAVRQGPILTANLRAALRGRPLQPFRPQGEFLSLLNTGDSKAILSYGSFAWRGRWAWRLKDWIDRRFIRRYERPALAPPDSSMGPMTPCGGCAAKVGADSLARVLERLDIPRFDHVTVGIPEADDGAVFKIPEGISGTASVATTDLFPPFSEDLALVGYVAAVNAASDVYAMGAEPAAALAIVSVASESPRHQEEELEHLLRGALDGLAGMNIPLVGGHTIALGSTLVGFSMHGFADPDHVLTKGGALSGDVLVLSKPIGTGVILAAARAGHADADWFTATTQSMQRGNGPVMRLLVERGVRSCTDVTGFGLIGHLAEMARASGCTAALDAAAVPALPGALELLQHGWRSSFHAANENAKANEGDARNPLLVDPQTSGGLIAAVPPREVDALLAACKDAGEEIYVIGAFAPPSDRPVRIA